jgi:hypothetical protein
VKAIHRTCSEWAELFRCDYLARGSSETTWRTDYAKILNRLPQKRILTATVLHELVLASPVNTKTRIRTCMVAGALARFAKIDYNPAPYRGKYSPQRAAPRDIPSDEQILKWFESITNPAWRWAFGIIATYGLRPHEVFHLDLDRLRAGDRVLQVSAETKTGARAVWAFHPEWFDDFALAQVILPPVRLPKRNDLLGAAVGHYFHSLHLGIKAYNLRHRWAIRTLEYGLDNELSAKQMGHSLLVHNSIYHQWIDHKVHQRAYEKILQSDDRPAAPRRSYQSKNNQEKG